MKDILLKYLLQYQQLGLPGIGYLQLYARASQTDIVNHRILPPTPAFRFSGDIPTGVVQGLVRYLSRFLQVEEAVASRRLTEFCEISLDDIRRGTPLEWEGLGRIKKGLAGELKFELAKGEFFAFPPVPAERVLRSGAEHTILVGDTEKTSTQMTELLTEDEPVRGSRWWIWALILALGALIGIGAYYAAHQNSLNNFRNQQAIPQSTP